MRLYTGDCQPPTGNVAHDGAKRCRLGTIGCLVKHVRRPNAVVLAEERLATMEAMLAEWSRGTASERNCADDLRAALDKVQVPR